MASPAIQAQGIHKNYFQGSSQIDVLKDLDFEISPGETVAVIGQSGSGKSTFLSLLAGLDTPTRGTVSWLGKSILGLSEVELAQIRAKTLGIVFQQFHLMPYLNALENVSLPLEINQVTDARKIAQNALRKVGLENRLDHLPQQMSGGEKQRVAIARAFVVQPQVLLADEPSGSLDPKTGAEIMDLLFEQVKTSQMALVLVTHNSELAKKCDRQLQLKSGKLISV